MDPIESFLVIIVLIYLGVFLCDIILKTRKMEFQVRRYYYGIALFIVMFIIARILFILNDIMYYQTGDPSYKHGFYYVLGSFIVALAAFAILFVVEKYIVDGKLHFIPSIIILISAILMLILPQIGEINMVTIYSAFVFLSSSLIPLLYIQVGLKVSGRHRKKSILLALGLIIFFIGNILNMGILKDKFSFFRYLSP
ncbi:MAG: hypothetical protein ACTSQJ_18690, partial [Promethearchaeota archaeon]